MDSTELASLERRVRRRYEWSRARRALVGLAPGLVVVGVGVLLAERPASAAVFGASMLAAGAVLLWYGRDVRRAVLPGVLAGMVPLVLSVCAHHVGGPCTVDRCTGFCLPVCGIGGLVAGVAVATVAYRRRYGAGFWVTASGLALLTGAMGCACVGHMGLVGLALGYGAGMAPSLVRRFQSHRTP